MAEKRNAMTGRRIDRRTVAFVGGLVGLVAFLACALVPSLVYGGYAGVVLAAALLGAPLGTGLLARGIVAFGMLAGLLATAGLFVVGGAAVGTMMHWTTIRVGRAVRVARERRARAAEAHQEQA